MKVVGFLKYNVTICFFFRDTKRLLVSVWGGDCVIFFILLCVFVGYTLIIFKKCI